MWYNFFLLIKDRLRIDEKNGAVNWDTQSAWENILYVYTQALMTAMIMLMNVSAYKIV